MIDYPKGLHNCRYFDVLKEILDDPELGADYITHLAFSSQWDGSVFIVVHLESGKYLGFNYDFISGSKDPWHNLTKEQIKEKLWEKAQTYDSKGEIL